MSKFALLVGINYRGTSSQLQGCINDVQTMKKYLISTRGYIDENIVVLTEDEVKKPTGVNIMHELSILIMRAHSHNAKEIWFHYSGHGSYVRDIDGDEDDGRDETIVPLDYAKNGMVTDDVMHDYLEHLPENCKLYCIFDCCHSGTILDLKYQYRKNSINGIENKNSTIKGNVVMISGCTDIQTSADTKMQGKWCGAMTAAYMHCIKDDITCETLLNSMRDFLKSHGYSQYPQMCSSHAITSGEKF
jgi:metacaspase-1